MDDDFNTAEGMSVLFDLVRDGNRHLDAGEDAGPQIAAFDELVGVLGLDEPAGGIGDLWEQLIVVAERFAVNGAASEELVEGLIAARMAARQERDFSTSDAIRDSLADVGLILEDGADGTSWHRR
jgi:cysteinyl-tRNA synthetase